jgi:hypothetical protein
LANLAYYKHGIDTIVPAFRNIYCPPQPAAAREICFGAPIEARTQWGIGAFAVPDDAGGHVQISAGMALTFDFMSVAYLLSNHVTGSNGCFYEWSDYYSSILLDNQTAIAAGQQPEAAQDLVGFARSSQTPACRRIGELSDRDVGAIVDGNAGERAAGIEASLNFVLLHEIGHLVLHHHMTQDTPLAARRRMEMDADNWAIDAATAAHQCIMSSFAPPFLADAGGAGSLNWEKTSDHPLGIRRYLNFLVRMQQSCESNPTYLSRVSEADRAAVHADTDRVIGHTRACVDAIDQGRRCSLAH